MIALLASLAAAAEPLGLDDVWASVSATHPLLDAARTRAEVAGQERIAAAGALDPVLSGRVASQLGQYDTQSAGVKSSLGTLWGAEVSAGWQRGVGTFDPYEGSLKTVDPGEWVLGFDVALLRDAWTDRKRASLRIAGQGLAVADADVRQRELELLRVSGQRWTEWEAAGQRQRIAERLLAIAEARDRAFATQEALGEVPPLVRLDNQRLVLERRERLVQARRAFEQASIELATWLRDGEGRTLLPSAEVLLEAFEPPAPLGEEDRVSRAWEQRPELVRLRAQLAQLDVERRLQANQALPMVDVVGKTYLPLDDKYEDEVELGVVAEWTALARTARARREVADANLVRVEAELAFARDRIEADVRDAESAARAADGRVAVARELVATPVVGPARGESVEDAVVAALHDSSTPRGQEGDVEVPVWWWLATAVAAPVTLTEAIDAALAENRDVAAARWAVVASEGRSIAGRSAWDPVLTASTSTSTQQSAGFVAGYPIDATTASTRAALGVSATAPTGTTLAVDSSVQHDTTTTVSQLGGVESTQENSNWTTSVGVSLSQDVLAPLRSQPGAITVRQAREARSQAELERDAAEQQVVVTVASLWWAAWAAGEAVRAADAQVAVARALEETARAKHAEGALAALEVDRATADRLSAERARVVARADAQDARDALAVAMGGQPGDDPSPEGRGEVELGAPVTADALWEPVSARDPSLLLARARRDAARAVVGDAADGWLPTLDAVGTLGTGALQDDATGAFSAMLGADGLPRASVSLQLTAPLGAHAARGRRDEAAAELRSAEAALDAAEATLRTSLRSAVTDLEAARAGVELARLRVDVARATEDGEQARVDEGASRLDQLLDARAARVDAEAELRTATAEAGRARITLDALLGAEVDRG